LTTEGFIRPDLPLPPGIGAAVSTRRVPGASTAPYDAFNVGSRCGDDPSAVAKNRAALPGLLGLPAEPYWLRQVHGAHVVRLRPDAERNEPEADAAVADHGVLAIQTADCLPVLFCLPDGSRIGAAHAGWRGLAAGVLEATVQAMGSAPLAWMGPCIGAMSYEVGEEVRAAFVDGDPRAAAAFTPTRPGHWRCDLYALARLRLADAGVAGIYGGGFDTFADDRFYSYRRDAGASGRFVSLIWR
jgi:purine-nucleoside/S-methyl-5'-thioadenosine phosphorylase / adenosine deaminase